MILHYPTFKVGAVSDGQITATGFKTPGGVGNYFLKDNGTVGTLSLVETDTLQSVTNRGNSTTQIIRSTNYLEAYSSGLVTTIIQPAVIFSYGGTINHFMQWSASTGRITNKLNSAFSTELVFSTASANRTLTLPNKSGTIAVTTDIPNYSFTSPILLTGTTISHSNLAGNKHIPSGGSTNQILRWGADGTAVWGAESAGGSQDLNQVLTIGNYATTTLTIGNVAYTNQAIHGSNFFQVADTSGSTISTTQRAYSYEIRNNSWTGSLLATSLSGTRNWTFPNKSGTVAMLDDISGGGATNLSTTHSATTVVINSDTGTDATINGATGTLAGVITTGTQTLAGVKTFINNVNLSNSNLTVTGGSISTQGNISSSGNFITDTPTGGFISSTNNLILGNSSSGTVYIRAFNYGAVTNQTTFTSSLVTMNTPLLVGGDIRSESGTFVSETAVCTIGTNSSGTIYLKPNGQFSPIGQSLFSVSSATIGTNLTVTGTVTAQDFIGNSDIRLKENIKALLPRKLNTEYKSFYFKGSEQKRVGLIAQEVEKNYPEFIRIDCDGIRSVSYIDLHSEELAYLKSKVEELELIINSNLNK